jgi:hypothetical protein
VYVVVSVLPSLSSLPLSSLPFLCHLLSSIHVCECVTSKEGVCDFVCIREAETRLNWLSQPWLLLLFVSDSFLSLPQTSIMAVEFDGGVVMGADSRTTTGVWCIGCI